MPRRSRQAVLFLVAIAAPCLLLVGLTLRILAQERELAEKRRADDRRRLTADIRQDLVSRLARLRLDALESSPAAGIVSDPAVPLAFAGRMDGDALALPWKNRAPAERRDESPAFLAAIRTGEQHEFARRRYREAAASYTAALPMARGLAQRALVQLSLARVLTKERHNERAHALLLAVLRTPAHVVDDQNVPLALYAGRGLIDSPNFSGADAAPLVDILRGVVHARPVPDPAAVHMARDLVAAALAAITDVQRRAAMVELRDQTERLVRDVEQTLALHAALPMLLARARSAAAAPDDVIWMPFGHPDSVWLVGIGGRSPVITAFHLSALADSIPAMKAGGAAVVVSSGGEPLGDSFPGLFLRPGPDADPADDELLQRTFYMTALLLVVGVALTGGYLFWRDTRREVRLAALRSQFVSSVSHELRTPLTSIRLFAETLLSRRPETGSARQEYLETILNESERLTRLLDNVLDFAKIEAGRKTYHLQPCSPAEVARSAASTMEYLLARQGFELQMTIDADVPPVLADRDALEQALLNLLSNAVKYSGAGRVIRLGVRRDEHGVVIDVVDEGIGIPAAEQRRIFDKFYRISGPEHARVPGTGLGLTLAAHIVAAHHGGIRVESQVGRGSRFSIALPADTADMPASAGARAPA